eukprot:14488587-Alexandrium_andersonii.AAC.1
MKAKPIFLLLGRGHCRAAIPTDEQVAIFFRHNTAVKCDGVQECPRAGGRSFLSPANTNTSDISQMLRCPESICPP